MEKLAGTFKQLDIIMRAKLTSLIKAKYPFSKIAQELGISRQTIYREIQRNSTTVNHDGYLLKHSCMHFLECHKGRKQKTICINNCPRYILDICKLLKKAPFVCELCSKRAVCKKLQYFYDPEVAQKQYRHILKHSRKSIRIEKGVFTKVNKVVPLLVNKGHSVEAILMGHPELAVSQSTIRRWINQRRLDCSPSQLRMTGRRKISKKYNYSKNRDHERLTLKKEGFKYVDYLVFVHDHPNALIVQLDTVMGTENDKLSVLTIHIVRHHFMFGFLLFEHTNEEVMAKINSLLAHLKEIDLELGTILFNRFTEVMLTDNGPEFDGLLDLNDEKTHVFYCHPNSSFEKGHIERNHVLLRYIQWKGISISDLTQEKVDLIFSHINSYPRKSLNGKTPYQCVYEDLGPEFIDATNIIEVAYDDVILNPSLIKKTK